LRCLSSNVTALAESIQYKYGTVSIRFIFNMLRISGTCSLPVLYI